MLEGVVRGGVCNYVHRLLGLRLRVEMEEIEPSKAFQFSSRYVVWSPVSSSLLLEQLL